jgi:hypothetical protein
VHSTLEHWLKSRCHTSEGPYLLPFAPNKCWRLAPIFVVGLNPTAAFREEFSSFNHFWAALTRDPDSFQTVYREKYLEGGIERSRTQNRIREVLDYLAPFNVLVTNVFAYPSTNPLHIPKAVKQEPIEERILSRLLVTCKPKAVFFHGVVARRFGEQFYSVKLDPYALPHQQQVTGTIRGTTARSHLFAYHHFVGRVEHKDKVTTHLAQFAAQIRQVVESP